MSDVTDTRGLSRKEHLLTKIEAGERLNLEEIGWANALLNEEEMGLALWNQGAPPPEHPWAVQVRQMLGWRL